MSNIVYVVRYSNHISTAQYTVGVFTSLEKAKEIVEQRKREGTTYHIHAYRLDEPGEGTWVHTANISSPLKYNRDDHYAL